jgi:hypothetical protein
MTDVIAGREQVQLHARRRSDEETGHEDQNEKHRDVERGHERARPYHFEWLGRRALQVGGASHQLNGHREDSHAYQARHGRP